MISRRLARLFAVVFALGFGGGLTTQAAAQAQVHRGDADVTPLHVTATDHAWLGHLTEGRFDEALDAITKADTKTKPLIGEVRGDLARFVEHHERRAQRRNEEMREALTEARDELKADHVELGLIAGIRAQGLSVNPTEVLDEPAVRTLIEKALASAKKAENDHDWVEAVSLYRLLDMLYEHDQKYADDVDRAAMHVRVLQTYAPNELRRMLEDRDERLRRDQEPEDDDADNAEEAEEDQDEIELDSWEVRLKSVEFDMLRFALRRAQDKHVDSQPIKPMVISALEAIRTLVLTGGLEKTFPQLANVDERDRFVRLLDRHIERLEAPAEQLSRFDAEDLLQSVIERNKATLKLPEEVLVYEMSQGVTDTLDTFSNVIWPSDLDQLKRSIDGSFVGVGVQIQRLDGKLTVVSPLIDTPAQKAGLRADDVIAEVDGVKTGTWTLDKAVRKITGPRGTVVTLGIERMGEPKLLQVPIVRDEIKIEPIMGWTRRDNGRWDYWLDRDSGVGYVRLAQFVPQSADDLDAAIAELQAQGELEALVLDLRFNPGGLLSSAIDICDRFLTQGDIVSTVNRDGVKSTPHRARARGTLPQDIDLVILINQGSASASEIVSGTLQAHHRAFVIGSRSYGKGSVQNLYPIATQIRMGANGKPVTNALGLPQREASAYLKLTTEYYMIAGGRIIHRKDKQPTTDPEWGITPDLVIDMTEDEVAESLELRQEMDVLRDKKIVVDPATQPATRPADALLVGGADPQLEAALLLLKAQLAANDQPEPAKRQAADASP